VLQFVAVCCSLLQFVVVCYLRVPCGVAIFGSLSVLLSLFMKDPCFCGAVG